MIFWNLGLLFLFECIDGASKDSDWPGPALLYYASDQRRRATSAYATVSRCIMDVPYAHNPVIQGCGTPEDSFLDCHVNTTLVVLAFEKAIQHSVDLLCSDSAEEGHLEMQDLKPMLSCLLSIKSNLAEEAFNRLVQNSSDMILECWLVDE